MKDFDIKVIRFKRFIKNYYHQKQAMTGFVMLVILLFVAAFAGVLAPHSPTAFVSEPLHAPCSEFPLGTDNMGRDVLSRILYGSRVSLLIGVVAASISAIIGTLLGSISGYFGGMADTIISEVIDIFLMIPTFFLILLVASIMGTSLINIMVVIGFTSWPGNARVMRSQALSLKNRTFVMAARAMGEPERAIMFKYIIPNGIFPVISNTTMQIAMAILTEAGLSFLGIGDPSAISWGQMIYAGRDVLTTGWWAATFPGFAIIYTVATFYMIGDGLNRVLNPKLSS